MVTVGARKTGNETVYFAAFGGWASDRSYPGIDGLCKAVAESLAYQEWLLLGARIAFDEFWARYWHARQRGWEDGWDGSVWEDIIAPEFESAMHGLCGDCGLTLSPLAGADRRYSYASKVSGIHEPGFKSPRAVIDYLLRPDSPTP